MNANVTAWVTSDRKEHLPHSIPAAEITALVYTYQDGSVTRTGTSTFSTQNQGTSGFGAPPVTTPPPESLVIRQTRIAGRLISLPWPRRAGLLISLMSACGVLAILVPCFLTARAYRVLLRRIVLLRHGVATRATVLQRTTKIEDRSSFAIHYSFSDPEGHVWVREENCTPEQYARLPEGKTVSVLYSAGNPRNSGLYPLVTFERARS
jgi:hypothetical protein